jgi:signal transduction histidine kinase
MRLNFKLLISSLSTVVIVFMITIGLINYKFRLKAFRDAKEIADITAKEYANLIRSEFNTDLGLARTLSKAFSSFNFTDPGQHGTFAAELLRRTLINNPRYIAVFIQWELSAIQHGFKGDHGRLREIYVREPASDSIFHVTDTLDIIDYDPSGAYYRVKNTGEEWLLNPYYFSYKDFGALPKEKPSAQTDILETTLVVPVYKEHVFAGVTGIDIPLKSLQQMVDTIQPFPDSYAFLSANNGSLISGAERSIINEKIQEVFPDYDSLFAIHQKIREGEPNAFITSGFLGLDEESYVTMMPVSIGNSDYPWSLGIVVPTRVIFEEARKNLNASILTGIIAVIVLIIIISLISRSISYPIEKVTRVLNKIARGEIDQVNKLEVTTSDEIGEMVVSTNTLINGLNRTASFAREVGDGNLDAEYKLLSDGDEMGKALIDMRNNIKRQNQQLQTLSLVARGTDNAVTIMNAQGMIEWCNRPMQKIYQDTIENIVGCHITEVSFNPDVHNLIEKCVSDKRTITYEANDKRRDLWIQTTITPLLNKEKEVTKLISIDADVSGIKKAEQKITSQKEKIEKQKERLEELVATRDKFFSIIAHDMKNPFASLLSITQSLSESFQELEPDEAQFYLKRVFQSADLIHNMLINLLEWSNAQTGRLDFEPVNVLLKEIADEICLLYSMEAEKKKITLTNQITDDIMVRADKDMVRTILRNLVNNAVKFTDHSGKVFIEALRDSGYIRITVRDTGIGLAEEEIGKLFRIDVKTKSIGPEKKEKGTGLGLILCKEFIEKN